MIVAATPSAVLLGLPLSVQGGWRVRPGMYSVVRPYDQDTKALPPEEPGQLPPPGQPVPHQDESRQPPSDDNTRPSKRRKIKARHLVRSDQDEQEREIIAWIRQELAILTCTKEAQAILNSKSHLLAHPPPSEECAIDFAAQAEMMRLLKHGFGRSTSSTSKGNDEAPFDVLVLDHGQHHVDQLSQIYETVVSNPRDTTTLLSLPPSSLCSSLENAPHYVVPPRSSWVMSDFDQIHRLTASVAQQQRQQEPGQRVGFDVIVMDPPWPNASVDRMAHYATMDMYELFKIPIPKLLSCPTQSSSHTASLLESPPAMVAVWITNRRKVYKLVTEKLFPAWGLELVACWYWLKITNKGEPVLHLESRHRRPYERVLIGRKKGSTLASSSSPSTSLPQIPVPTSTPVTTRLIERKLIVSVPGLHSRKPCLDPLIEEWYCSQQAHSRNQPIDKWRLNKLELFARNLEPGWVSWGNEPLRFQYCGHADPSSSNIPPHSEFVQDGFLVGAPPQAS